MAVDIRVTDLVICQNIVVAPAGSQTLINTITELRVSVFPFSLSQLAAFVRIEGSDLAREIRVVLTRDDDLTAIATAILRTDRAITRATSSMEAFFYDVEFPSPGTYRVRVFADDGSQLRSMRLIATQMSPETAIALVKSQSVTLMAPQLLNAEEIEVEEVVRLLAPWPQAIALYNELRHDFGNAFCVVRRADGTGASSHSIVSNIQTHQLEKAAAEIAMESGNPAGALAGQLQLLNLYREGFPLLRTFAPDDAWPLPAMAVNSCASVITAVLFLIVSERMTEGLTIRDAMINSPSPIDMNQEIAGQQHMVSLRLPDPVTRAPWNTMYFLRVCIRSPFRSRLFRIRTQETRQKNIPVTWDRCREDGGLARAPVFCKRDDVPDSDLRTLCNHRAA